MQRGAVQDHCSLTQGLVLSRVCVDELSDVLGECFPSNPHLSLTNLLTHALTNSVNTNDGAVLLADNLHDTGSTEDSGLAVTSQVVLSGLNVLSAELLLSLGLGVTNGSDLRVTEGDLGDVHVFNDGGVQASDFLSNEDTLLVTAVSQLNAGERDVANSVDVAHHRCADAR